MAKTADDYVLLFFYCSRSLAFVGINERNGDFSLAIGHM